jgi:hypothetical protein
MLAMLTPTLLGLATALQQAYTVVVAAVCLANTPQRIAKPAQQQVLYPVLYSWDHPASRCALKRQAFSHADNLWGAASAPDTAVLGQSGLTVSSLGIGTLQWGDTQCGYGSQYDEV